MKILRVKEYLEKTMNEFKQEVRGIPLPIPTIEMVMYRPDLRIIPAEELHKRNKSGHYCYIHNDQFITWGGEHYVEITTGRPVAKDFFSRPVGVVAKRILYGGKV